MNQTKQNDAIVFNPRYDRVWRLIAAYIMYMLCYVVLKMRLGFITPEMHDAVVQWKQAIMLPCLVGIYRLFFGPLVPRIREVWGRAWVKLPVSLIVVGVLLFGIMILQDLALPLQKPTWPMQTPLMSLLLLPLGIAIAMFFGYGIVYRLFARMRMSLALLTASLYVLIPIIIIVAGAMAFDVTDFKGSQYYVALGIVGAVEACWGLYIYKRYNSLTPAAILVAAAGLVSGILKLAG